MKVLKARIIILLGCREIEKYLKHKKRQLHKTAFFILPKFNEAQ